MRTSFRACTTTSGRSGEERLCGIAINGRGTKSAACNPQICCKFILIFAFRFLVHHNYLQSEHGEHGPHGPLALLNVGVDSPPESETAVTTIALVMLLKPSNVTNNLVRNVSYLTTLPKVK